MEPFHICSSRETRTLLCVASVSETGTDTVSKLSASFTNMLTPSVCTYLGPVPSTLKLISVACSLNAILETFPQ